ILAEGSRQGLDQRFQIQGDFTQPATWPVRVRLAPLKIEGSFELKKTADAAEVTGLVLWQTNQLTLASRFPRNSWLPSDAKLNSDSFRFPAADAKLDRYSDLSGSLSAQWHQGQLSV